MPKIGIDEQIAEVGREIGIRKGAYPGFVARGKLTQEEADDHLARMEAVYKTLKWIKENRASLVADELTAGR